MCCQEKHEQHTDQLFGLKAREGETSKAKRSCPWCSGESLRSALRIVPCIAARGKSPDSSDYRSFRNLTWRWFIVASGKPKTSNRAGSTPRSASRADSSRSNGPFSPQKAQNDAPGLGPADSGASPPPSGGASAVPG